MRKIWKNALKKATAFLLALAMVASPVADYSALSSVQAAEATFTATKSGGYEEGAYVEWAPVDGADGYIVSVSKDGNTWTELDDQLIRKYPTYWRADALGLTAGTWSMKVEAVTLNASKEKTGVVSTATVTGLSVVNYDRSGFCFSTISDVQPTEGIGAYKADGTLKSGAQVIYVTAATAKTVTANVNGETVTGLQAILSAKEKENTSNDILDIRVIGKISPDDVDSFGSSEEGIQIKGKAKYTPMNITVEGVGEDASIWGFGFLIRNCTSVEMRNLGFLNFKDDGVSIDSHNSNLWIHDLDLFYGAGGSGDHKKGDGSIDLKVDSKYLTISYNHFFDSGKSSLCGMKSETGPNYITYHHNWFDHSDSRHPRIRTMSVHIYNNYYDGVSKYGVGAVAGASAFVESNYFRNCKYPMLISDQGSDLVPLMFDDHTGGGIKAYNNHIEGASSLVYANANPTAENGATASMSADSYDAYLASTRDEKVPETYVAKIPGKYTGKYDNFDTTVDLGVTEDKIDALDDIVANVISKAGRVNGGDLKWNPDNSVEDASDVCNAALSEAVVNYVSSLVSVGGRQNYSTTVTYTVTFDPANGDETWTEEVASGGKVTKPADPTNVPEGKVFAGWYKDTSKYNFDSKVSADITLTAKWVDEGQTSPTTGGTYVHNFSVDGETSDFYTIVSGHLKTNQPEITYGSLKLQKPYKWETGSAITFTAPADGTLTLVFGPGSDNKTGNVKIGGTKVVADSNYIITKEVKAGTVELTKGDAAYLYYISLVCGDGGTNDGGDPTPTEYTVTVNADNGSANKTIKVTEGNTVAAEDLGTTPTKDGYTFLYWAVGSTQISFPYKPTGNVTIKAIYKNNETGEPDKKPVNKKLKAGDIPAGTYAESFNKNGFTINAGTVKKDVEGVPTDVVKNVTVDGNNKSIDGVDYTVRLKTNGAGDKDYQSVSFTAEKEATLYIACMAPSSSSTTQMNIAKVNGESLTNLTGEYTVNYNGTKTTANTADGNIPVKGDKIASYTMAIPAAGDYVIFGADAGLNIYAINLTYEDGVDATSYTVTFNANGGLAVKSQSVQDGECAVEPTAFRDGYDLEGWYTDSALQNKFSFTTPITAPVTLYAKWNEGEKNTSLVLDMSELPTGDYAENFTKNGFSFKASADKAVSIEPSAKTVNEKAYTKRFKFNGKGTASERCISFTITEDSTLTIVAESASSGNARTIAVANGSTVNKFDAVDAATEMTMELTAGTWSIYAVENGMNIYYLSVVSGNGGGQNTDPTAKKNMSLNVGTDLPSNTYTSDFVKNGFTIHAGAKTDDKDASIVVEGNAQTISGTAYTKRLKTIGAGTEAVRSISFTTEDAATLKIAALNASSSDARNIHVATMVGDTLTDIANGSYAVPAKAGGEGDFKSIALAEANTYYIYGDGGVNIYAIDVVYAGGVAATKHTVTFNSNGGSAIAAQKVLDGEKAIEDTELFKGGYTFAGWYTDTACTTKYNFATPVTANITLNAKWTEGEDGENLVLDMKDVPTNTYTAAFSRHGFNVVVGTEGAVVDANSKTVDGVDYTRRLKFTKKDGTQYIGFTAAAASTVTIIGASSSGTETRALSVVGATTQTSDKIGATPVKMTFTVPAGSYKVYSQDGGFNIYAISVKSNSTTKYTVTVDKADSSATTSFEVTEGDAVTTVNLPTPTREGYTFKGWTVNGEAITLPYIPAGNVTVVATWQKDSGEGPGNEPGNDPSETGMYIIGLEESYEFTGAKIIPNIGVVDYDADRILAPGVDYAVKLANNVKVNCALNSETGEYEFNVDPKKIATVTIVGKGNYAGKSAVKTFKIVPASTELEAEALADLTGAKIAKIDAKLYSYTGEAIFPDIILTLKGKDAVTYTYENGEYADKDGNPIPAKWAVSNNINKGTATILLTGKANAKGKDTVAKATFKINPKNITTLTGVKVEAEAGVYNVKGAAPASITVTYNDGADKLLNGTDYTVKYAANKTATEAATITVTGKGNYTGKLPVATYKVEKLNLSDVEVLGVKATAGMTKGKISATVTDLSGNVLKAKQYTLDVKVVTKDGKELTSDKDKLSVGDVVTVKAIANDANLEGETTEAEFTVAADFSKVKATIIKVPNEKGKLVVKPFYYTGLAITLSDDPEKSDLEVTMKGVANPLVLDEDYEIVGYSNNINKGTATVTLRGKNGYIGTKVVKFKITAKPVALENDNSTAWDDVSHMIKSLFGLAE